MQLEASVLHVRRLVDVVDSFGIERGRSPLDAMHFVAFFEQKFCKIGTVLAGYTGYEC
jgi:hypothetical protein